MIIQKQKFLVFLYLFVKISLIAGNIDHSITVTNGNRCFTSQFCRQIGFKRAALHVRKKRIDLINADALNSCGRLKTLEIAETDITTLDKNLFKYNTGMIILNLRCNNINYLPPEVFSPLTNLKHLHLNANPLKKMPPVLNGNLHNLKWLDIENIRIFAEDIDVNNVKSSLPSLTRIGFQFNYIDCKTMKSLEMNFRSRRVVSDHGTVHCERLDSKRCYTSLEVDLARKNLGKSGVTLEYGGNIQDIIEADLKNIDSSEQNSKTTLENNKKQDQEDQLEKELQDFELSIQKQIKIFEETQEKNLESVLEPRLESLEYSIQGLTTSFEEIQEKIQKNNLEELKGKLKKLKNLEESVQGLTIKFEKSQEKIQENDLEELICLRILKNRHNI